MNKSWWIKISAAADRGKALLVAGMLAGLVVSGLVFYLFLHRPLQAETASRIHQAEGAAQEVSRIVNFRNAHLNDKEQRQALAKRQAAVDKALPDQLEQGLFLGELERLTRRCQLQLLALSPEPAEQAEGYKALTVKLRLQGSYFQLMAFLQGLRDGERLVTVKKMALQCAQGQIAGDLWLEIYAVSNE